MEQETIKENVELVGQTVETTKIAEAEVKQQEKKAVAVYNPGMNEAGQIVPKNLGELKTLCAGFIQSGILPKRYETVAQVITAYQMATELGLRPLTALRQIAVIEGTPSLFGDLPLSLCMNAGIITYIEEFFVDKEYNRIEWKNKNLGAEPYAAVCILKRKGQKKEREFFFTMDDARNAGLYPAKKRNGEDSPNSPWMKYTRYMLKYRARSNALKDMAPDALNGLAIAEYDFNTIPDRTGEIDEPRTETNPAKLLESALIENERPETQTNH